MAAPHVTGLAALLYQSEKYLKKKKKVTPAEIKDVLKQGCLQLRESPLAQGSGLVNFTQSLPAIEPPRRLIWRWGNKKKKLHSVIPQTSESETAATQNTTCPSRMNLFCPHYDERICNAVYETCIHYQSANQANILKTVKDL